MSAVSIAPPLPEGVAHTTEQHSAGLFAHPEWAAEMPWIVQGITTHAADMSLFAGAPAAEVIARWRTLQDAVACTTVVHARQVHAAAVHVHRMLPPGILIAPDADGHLTAEPDVLLVVSVADCVPISIVAPDVRAIALLHAGWRGAAAGILEHGITKLAAEFGADARALRIHLGPAICGACYEVGREVPAALAIDAHDVTHVAVRAALAQRALACGVSARNVTVSTFCTRHGDAPFFSHRGGCSERQISVLAIRDAGA